MLIKGKTHSSSFPSCKRSLLKGTPFPNLKQLCAPGDRGKARSEHLENRESGLTRLKLGVRGGWAIVDF